MSFLKPRGRVLLELLGVLYAGLVIVLAIVAWAGHFAWRLDPSSFILVAGVVLMVVIYLVLDEVRLNGRR